MLDIFLNLLILAFIIPLIIQGIFNLYITLYGWESPERMKAARAPEKKAISHTTFSILLPCYHEEEVIGETLRKLSLVDYPKKLIEILVIVRDHDTATIKAAEQSIVDNQITNARVLIYAGDVPGKPPQLNAGLMAARNKVVTIFDSEDDVSPKLFSAVNTLFLARKPDIVQAGVQLMDYDTRWFSLPNVLEYFFWFRSCMHFFAHVGAMPLGGNTVFFHRRQLKRVGGWDESLLTEDADIGFRLSVKGKKTIVMYDPELVTREETPPTIEQFVKQRTRWVQGFMQILKKGDWKRLPRRRQQILAFYVMFAPVVQAALVVTFPLFVLVGLFADVHEFVGLISFTPLVILLCWFAAQMVGMYEFSREQKLSIGITWYIKFVIVFPLYQIMLSFATMRAVRRYFQGAINWEKTKHVGTHRVKTKPAPEVAKP